MYPHDDVVTVTAPWLQLEEYGATGGFQPVVVLAPYIPSTLDQLHLGSFLVQQGTEAEGRYLASRVPT